jgi:hypothetical protein
MGKRCRLCFGIGSFPNTCPPRSRQGILGRYFRYQRKASGAVAAVFGIGGRGIIWDGAVMFATLPAVWHPTISKKRGHYRDRRDGRALVHIPDMTPQQELTEGLLRGALIGIVVSEISRNLRWPGGKHVHNRQKVSACTRIDW